MKTTCKLDHKLRLIWLLIFLPIACLAFPISGFAQATIQINKDSSLPECLNFTVESKVGFHPDIQQLRLEQIEPKQYFVPIQFGSHKSDFVIEKDLRVQRLEFQLSSHVQFMHAATERAMRQDNKPTWSLRGESYFESGAKYRLTWTRGSTASDKDESELDSATIEFQIPASDELQNASKTHVPKFYLVETVFKDHQQDSLFVGQDFAYDTLPKYRHRRGTAISFKESTSLSPPHKGMIQFDRLNRLKSEYKGYANGKHLVQKPALAEECGWAARANAKQPKILHIGYSCELTSMARPQKGEKEFALWNNILYRVQVLDRNIERQRQDESQWKSRLKLILNEAESVGPNKTQKPILDENQQRIGGGLIDHAQNPDRINAWASAMKLEYKIKE